MSEYLEAEKEAGTYKAAYKLERGTKAIEECLARKSYQTVAKRAQPSSSEGGSSRKKARKGLKLKFHYRELWLYSKTIFLSSLLHIYPCSFIY